MLRVPQVIKKFSTLYGYQMLNTGLKRANLGTHAEPDETSPLPPAILS
jgi:hypothetical protein